MATVYAWIYTTAASLLGFAFVFYPLPVDFSWFVRSLFVDMEVALDRLCRIMAGLTEMALWVHRVGESGSDQRALWVLL